MVFAKSGGFTGVDDWGSVASILGSKIRNEKSARATYMVFDIMCYRGMDVRSNKLATRREAIESIIEPTERVQVSPQFPYSDEAYVTLLEQGFEGGVVKDPNSTYDGKRGYGWYRLKRTETIDVVVRGIVWGTGKFENLLGALVFGAYDPTNPKADDEGFVPIGQCSGMDDATRIAMTAQHAEGSLKGTVIEVKHYGQAPTGGYRHPQFLRVRTDKQATSCLLSEVSNFDPNWDKVIS